MFIAAADEGDISSNLVARAAPSNQGCFHLPVPKQEGSPLGTRHCRLARALAAALLTLPPVMPVMYQLARNSGSRVLCSPLLKIHISGSLGG